MGLPKSKHWLSFLTVFVDNIEKWSSVFGGLFIVVLMGLVVSDVIYRYLTGSSIKGAYELAELIMVAVCFFTLAYCQKERKHVRVEILVDHLRGKVLQFTEVAALMFCLLISFVFFYTSIPEAILSVKIRETTIGIIEWPAWPLKIVVVFGFFLLFVRIGIQLVEEVRLALVINAKNHREKKHAS